MFMRSVLIHLLLMVAASAALFAQEGPLSSDPPKGMTPEQVIQRFTTKEKEFKDARKQCTYQQSVKFQTLQGTEPNSEYRQVADVRFDANGNKVKSIVL